MTRRFSRFLAVGALGFAVQIAVAAMLLASGVRPVLATVLAIEAAVVSNHAWHRRWTWRDRRPAQPWQATILRAHVGAGGTSLAVGIAAVVLLAGRMPPLLAQVVAVGIAALINFWVCDRWVFPRQRACMALLATLLCAAPALAAGPSDAAIQSWDRYAAALQELRAREVARGAVAWATDDDPQGMRTLASLQRGEVVVGSRGVPQARVADATLEHWQGSVLVRGVSLAQVARRLRQPEAYPQPSDVLKLHVSARTEHGHDLYLRVRRSLLVTATYDTWHRVRHEVVSAARLDSTSVSTRIDELDGAETPRERRVPESESRGFLWRMQSWWRFSAVPGGVVVTCESITLSRPVPFGLGLMARPVITRVARESMTTAVRAWLHGW